jgi:hypothetical protein
MQAKQERRGSPITHVKYARRNGDMSTIRPTRLPDGRSKSVLSIPSVLTANRNREAQFDNPEKYSEAISGLILGLAVFLSFFL